MIPRGSRAVRRPASVTKSAGSGAPGGSGYIALSFFRQTTCRSTYKPRVCRGISLRRTDCRMCDSMALMGAGCRSGDSQEFGHGCCGSSRQSAHSGCFTGRGRDGRPRGPRRRGSRRMYCPGTGRRCSFRRSCTCLRWGRIRSRLRRRIWCRHCLGSVFLARFRGRRGPYCRHLSRSRV